MFTYFLSCTFEITKIMKFFIKTKPMSEAMVPPTQEAMRMVRVLSTTLTVGRDKQNRKQNN